MKQTIAVIEDEPDIQEIIAYNLRREGFDVICALDGKEGLKLILDKKPDLVLLDLMLPSMDGLEICRRVREESSCGHMPIIMVSAKGEESDIVLGLGLGADDYVSKPFKPKELIARVKAMLRRSSQSTSLSSSKTIVCGELNIDIEKHQAQLSGMTLALTSTEFKMLSSLAGNSGRVFTREQLINQSLGEHAVVVDRNIDVHIRGIRKKLGDQQDLIETIRGIGYRFKE